MRKFLILAIIASVATTATAQFSDFFVPKTLRLDYYHCGTATSEEFFVKQLIEEPHWAANKANLIDEKEYGTQLLKVYNKADGKLIYSQGFCTLFDEWQTTAEAKTAPKSYAESVVMPFPKQPVIVEISSRNRENEWVKKLEYVVDPESCWIRKSTPRDQTFDVVSNGAPNKKVDIVVLAEGYTQSEREAFVDDCERFAKELFAYSPYKERAKDFNVRGVWRPSQDAGVSLPGERIWKQTAMDAHYYTFDTERYLMIDDFQKVRDLASNVPYDVIYILSNTKKYGGGGIYNFYGISAAGDPQTAGKVFVHEFGHLFIGLGDEYVGTTGYEGFYPTDVEPWEENLTTLVDFDRKDWKKMLPKGTKIPTEDVAKNDQVLGVYEGGGYQNKGIYRPWRNCLMRDLKSTDHFCPVCTKTINDKIDLYTK